MDNEILFAMLSALVSSFFAALMFYLRIEQRRMKAAINTIKVKPSKERQQGRTFFKERYLKKQDWANIGLIIIPFYFGLKELSFINNIESYLVITTIICFFGIVFSKRN